MYHPLSRLLRHRLLLPSSASPSPAFSTSKRAYAARRAAKPPPSPPADTDASAPAAVAEGSPGWQREKHSSELPRPSTIPFQPRVANSVRLVGTVGAPVQLQRLPDGRFSAVSVLVQDSRADYPKFWIPVIFQDDLAQVAASHLRENDLVHVSGQLTGDVPPFKLTDGQANIQVLAQMLSFVDSKAVETDITVDDEEGFMKVAEAEKKIEAKKYTPTYAPRTFSGFRKKGDKFNRLWDDVVANPQDWIDNRTLKKNGSKNPKYPDFKNKVSQEALWLDSAPMAVLERLDDLVFGSGFSAGKTDRTFGGDTGRGTNWKSPDASVPKQKLEGDLWQNLVDNPQDWWDNRTDKFSPKAPDFKHKETGKPLWLGSQTPQWAKEALPPPKPSSGFRGVRKQETLLS